VVELPCPGCGGLVRARRRREVDPDDDQPPAGASPGGLELRLRLAGLRALEPLYRAGAVACVGASFVGGGFAPVLRGWLRDEIASWGDAAACLGALRIEGAWGSPDADHGPILARSDAPSLFDEIDEVGRRLGVKRPSQVRVAYLPCCGITSGARHRERALLIGLPLLEILSLAELRAVVAHELAHLAHGDVAGSARAIRFWERLAQALDAAPDPRRLSAAWARRCLRPAMRLLGPVARGQEIRADRAAAALAGGPAAASALVKVAMTQALFREVLHHYDPADPSQPNLYAFFRRFWSFLPAPLVETLRHSILTGAGASAPPRPDDPHPPILDRIQLVQSYPDRTPATPGEEPAAPALVGDLESLEHMMHNRLFGIPDAGPSVFHRAYAP
jgi:Zn-dependent protease with chaperone function